MAAVKNIYRRVLHVLAQQPVRQASAVGGAVSDQIDVRSFDDVPGPRGVGIWPIIGTLMLYKPFTHFTAATSHELVDSLFDKYGPLVKLRLGKVSVLISDPKDIETVFRSEGKYPFRPAIDLTSIYEKRKGLKGSLSSVNGEEWQALRTPLNRRLMKPDSASYYIEAQNAVADDFVNILGTEEKGPEDLLDVFFRFASESIGVVTFNTRLGFLDKRCTEDPMTSQFLSATKDLFQQLHKSLCGESIAHNFYRNKTYRDYERAYDILHSNAEFHVRNAKEVIKQKRLNGTLNPDEPNLLLSLASEDALTSDDVSNTLEVIYCSGTDSTARNLQVFFFNLANNQDKQKILRQEIRHVVGDRQVITAADISKMTYLKACLKESFRLNYPTALGTTRILPTDVVLSGYRIPAGVPILLGNPRACKQHFQQPDKFLPERWLRSEEGRQQEGIPKMALMPFGHGPRNCIGRRFAVQEIYLATIKVIQKLNINLEPESRATSFVYHIFPEPTKPLKFQFTKTEV